jgi:adenosylcobinamide-GDP ribazoletransferase
MTLQLALSAGMFTAVPVRAKAKQGPADAAWALLILPAIGAVIATAALAALTRGLHLDGLADSAGGPLVVGRVTVAASAARTVAALGFGAVIAEALSVPPGWILGPQAAAPAVGWLLRRHAVPRVGWINGDVFGALIETATAIRLIGGALR